MRVVVSLSCFVRLTVVAAFLESGPQRSHAWPQEKKPVGPKLDGIWVMKAHSSHDGKGVAVLNWPTRDATSCVLVVSGTHAYRIGGSLNVKVRAERISFHADDLPKAVDLFHPQDMKTLRGLYKLTKDEFTMCWHGLGKFTQRPGKFEVTKDGVIIDVYAKLPDVPAKKPEAAKPEAAKPDPKLTGVWETAGFQIDGEDLENGEMKVPFLERQHVFCFDEGSYTLIKGNGSGVSLLRQAYRLEPKQGKSAIDFLGKAGEIIPAIYECTNDHISICWNPNGGARPDQFQTEKDDGRELIRLKRVVP